MLPLLARKYLYRYLIAALLLPLMARLSLYVAERLQRRHGAPTTLSKLLRRTGRFTRRRANRALSKERQSDSPR